MGRTFAVDLDTADIENYIFCTRLAAEAGRALKVHADNDVERDRQPERQQPSQQQLNVPNYRNSFGRVLSTRFIVATGKMASRTVPQIASHQLGDLRSALVTARVAEGKRGADGGVTWRKRHDPGGYC